MQDANVEKVMAAIAENRNVKISKIYECEDVFMAYRYNPQRVVGLGPIMVDKKDYTVTFLTSNGSHLKYMKDSKLIWELK